jgi:hypothetical protein
MIMSNLGFGEKLTSRKHLRMIKTAQYYAVLVIAPSLPWFEMFSQEPSLPYALISCRCGITLMVRRENTAATQEGSLWCCLST